MPTYNCATTQPPAWVAFYAKDAEEPYGYYLAPAPYLAAEHVACCRLQDGRLTPICGERVDANALPEPTGGLLAGVLLLAVLSRFRR